MQRIVPKHSIPLINDLQDNQSVNIYYNEANSNFYIICSTDAVRYACESIGVLSAIVKSICDIGLKLNNIYVLSGALYSSEQIKKISIESFQKVTS